MGNGFNIDIFGVKEILSQIFKAKPEFPITEKQALIRALGGETQLVKVNEQNETVSAVLLAEEAFTRTSVFHNTNDIIDGIVGGSFINAVTKSKIYQDIQKLQFPVKHFRDLESLGSTLQLFGISWDQVKGKLELPVNSPAELILAISAADPAVVGTDVTIINGLELPDIATMGAVASAPPEASSPPSSPAPPSQPPVSPPPIDEPKIPETPSPPPEIQPPAPPGKIEPPAEVPSEETISGDATELKFGFSYLMKEDKPKQGFEVLAKGLKSGYEGMCITRTNPRQIRSKFDLEDTKIYWLTDRKGSEETTISPALENISYSIEGFIKKNDKTVVLLDGLEYLISVNKFNPVLSFIRRLIDFISEHDAVFIAPISPMTVGSQELKTLEREMEPVDQDELIALPSLGETGSEANEEPRQTTGGSSESDTSPPPSKDTPNATGNGKSCTPCEGSGKCFWCAGTGKCESCSGTGKRSDGSNCENCNGSGICDSCSGSKVCIWCKGTGIMAED